MSQDSPSTARPLVGNVLVPLLVVAISSYFAYQLAELNVDSARRQQTREFEIRRDDEARIKRAEVYQRYLNAANRFAVATRAAIAQCPARCPSPPSEYQNARYEFQGSINEIYVYGSEDALTKHRALAATLPPSLVGLSGEVTIEPVQNADFRRAYQEFQSVMCREIPPKPRNEC